MQVLVDMLNYLFHEDMKPDEATMTVTNATKYVNKSLHDYEAEGSLFFTLTDSADVTKRFHIKLQILTGEPVAYHMLKCDYAFAADNQKFVSDNTVEIYMPKPLVIHLEESPKIPDSYEASVVLGKETFFDYKVPVMKYWTFSDDELIETNLFPLLPLQLFLLLPEFDTVTKSEEIEIPHHLLTRFRKVTERLIEGSTALRGSGRLYDNDFEILMTAIDYSFKYLNDRYVGDEKLAEEVHSMIQRLKEN
jgi:hypothetical protein